MYIERAGNTGREIQQLGEFIKLPGSKKIYRHVGTGREIHYDCMKWSWLTDIDGTRWPTLHAAVWALRNSIEKAEKAAA